MTIPPVTSYWLGLMFVAFGSGIIIFAPDRWAASVGPFMLGFILYASSRVPVPPPNPMAGVTRDDLHAEVERVADKMLPIIRRDVTEAARSAQLEGVYHYEEGVISIQVYIHPAEWTPSK